MHQNTAYLTLSIKNSSQLVYEQIKAYLFCFCVCLCLTAGERHEARHVNNATRSGIGAPL